MLTRPSRIIKHSAVVFLHAAIVLWWLWPIVRGLSSSLPGAQAGDNVTFVWNVWWMRYVLHHPGQSFFSTPFLFYPVGTDLTLHTHTALPALVAAVVGPSSLVAAQNLLIIAHLFLNFVCSYALAYRATRQVFAALVASLIFGASPFVGAHLPGHFNLIAAWTIPLVVLCWNEAFHRHSPIFAALCGIVLGATAYIDYYLFIYAAIAVGLLAVALYGGFSTTNRLSHAGRRRALVIIAVLIALDIGVMLAILLWPADQVILRGIRVSTRSVRNPVTAAWLLALLAVCVQLYRRPRFAFRTGALVRMLAPVAAAATVVILPLLANGVKLWAAGRYVSQPYQWRSAPPGIDVATLVTGNPFNVWWGATVRGWYSSVRIDQVEGCGWIPLAGLVLAAAAIRVCWSEPVVRCWAFIGASFLVWALGPWLVVLGWRTPLVLPAILLRYVPIVANARMPGRAMILVYLAIAQISAFGLVALMRDDRRRLAAWALAALIAMDCAPAWPPFYHPRVPATYHAMHGPPGAICELPLGLRDGFGEVGTFDASVLLYQTVHQRPILGGFVARLSPDVVRTYRASPMLSTFVRLSSNGRENDSAVDSPLASPADLTPLGVAYVVLDTRAAKPQLLSYVRSASVLRLIGEEDGREFYEVRR
jgi:hypothetical protein